MSSPRLHGDRPGPFRACLATRAAPFLAALALWSPPANAAPPAPEAPPQEATGPEAAGEAHRARVRLLLRAMGQEALAVQVLRRTLDGLRQSLPQVPAAFWTSFEADIDPAELVELQVPVYAEALSAEDVEGLIAFYRSPTGRRFVAAQPAIVEGLQAAGERWGQTVARRALQALEGDAR